MIHKVGERISSYRKARNMSQEELAGILNVSRQTVSKWETGDSLPDVYNAVAIGNLFHLTLDELITGKTQAYGESSYMINLKETRRKTNVRAIIIGSIGSLLFAMGIVLSDALELSNRNVAIVFACIFPVLMLCWGYAIWNFIKISRISEEIKYIQKIELMNLNNKQKKRIS